MSAISLDAWRGRISGRTDPTNAVQLRLCIAPNAGSASGSFQAIGRDSQTYFVKPPGRPDLAKSLVTEMVVAGVGQMIGAPVCDWALVEITSALLPFEYQPGYMLQAGVGFATVAVPPAVIEERPYLAYRSNDDNAARHAGVFALYDWCWGSDQQWLHRVSDDWRLYSHDHGWYLPPFGPDWTISQLQSTVDEPHELPDDPSGLDDPALAELSSRLRAVTREDLAELLNKVPASWPVSDAELEVLGWYLERRAEPVAIRLEAL